MKPQEAFDKVDTFLRNNLGDDAYAEYSSALDIVYGHEGNGQSSAVKQALERLLEAYNFGQFSDGFNQPLALSIRKDIRTLLDYYEQHAEPQHQDDEMDDTFASAMKTKLARKRGEGRRGWQRTTAAGLSALLHELVDKGDPLDVANVAMMLHQNGQRIESRSEALERVALDVFGDGGVLKWVRDVDGDIIRHGIVKPRKPELDLLRLAVDKGATLTGNPSSTASIKVVFTIQAWRAFDAALQQGKNNDRK